MSRALTVALSIALVAGLLILTGCPRPQREYTREELLAVCWRLIDEDAGYRSAEELKAFYDNLQVKEYTPAATAVLSSPAQLHEYESVDIFDDGFLRQARGWSRSGDSSESYLAYTSSGLVSDRDVYLAIDNGSDDLYESIVPTGISDVFYYHTSKTAQTYVGDKVKLQLAIAADKVTIQHNKHWWHDSIPATTTISLRDLLTDSDGDGLTDITEQMLLTDADDPDTDGDGIDDLDDIAPLAAADQMGKLERGVARLLTYHFQVRRCDADWWELSFRRPGEMIVPGHPYNARYLRLTGCGPIAYSASPNCRAIALTEQDQWEEYCGLLQGYDKLSVCQVWAFSRSKSTANWSLITLKQT